MQSFFEGRLSILEVRNSIFNPCLAADGCSLQKHNNCADFYDTFRYKFFFLGNRFCQQGWFEIPFDFADRFLFDVTTNRYFEALPACV